MTIALIGSPETSHQRLDADIFTGVQTLMLRFVDGTALMALHLFASEFIM